VQILGIVNITQDSFSDGGQFLSPHAAVAHARQLAADGADLLDLGAESTHPDAEDVPAAEELRRLIPVIDALRRENLRISVDTYKPAVLRAVLDRGVDMINDVTGLRDPEAVAVLRGCDVPVILMHSTASAARAERREVDEHGIVAHVVDYFRRRIDELDAAGIEPGRLIVDPGMGFFLGRRAEVSLAMLRGLERLADLGRPVCVSTSRKSFLGAMLGGEGAPRPVAERAAGTLATEIWAALHGAAFIRTHAVRNLRDALRVWDALAGES